MLQQMLSKQDIYNILIPLCIPLLALPIEIVKNIIKGRQNRFWMNKQIPSSQDKYMKFLLQIYLSGLLFGGLCLVVCIALCLVPFLSLFIARNSNILKYSYVVLLLIIYALLAFQIDRPDIIKFRNVFLRLNNHKIVERIMIKLPVIASGLLWGVIMIFPDAATFSYILFIICIAMGFIFLNEEPYNEYAYAQFHFQDGSTLCNIKTQNITYKIKWIIVKNEDLNKEYHFRIEDVKQVEYYNI